MSDAKPWHIWIDTGGTFTDCLARDPAGALHRAKVLSHGALRGRIVERVDDRTLRIEQNWGGFDDAVAGFAFRALSNSDDPVHVVAGFSALDSVLRLADPWPADVEVRNAPFEVQSNEPAPILAARLLTGTLPDRSLPSIRMRLATTLGTNALLERKGSPTALFITKGFGDLLRIGDQQRPEIFALHIEKPPALYERVVEVSERIVADGTVLRAIEMDEVEALARHLHDAGIRSAAIALLHSYRQPAHEHALAEMLWRIGFTQVSCSSDIAPLIKILPRAQTAVVDAYLGPIVGRYLRDVQGSLEVKPSTASSSSFLHVMTSAGGLVRSDRYRACDSLLSGPAGGVAGAAAAARSSGFERVIGVDMGGTSTDVARFDGDFEYRFEHPIAGVRVMSPAINIETVAAGGGSICDVQNGRLIVGPHSAGANPGPACYGTGGPLTLTDVNLLSGRLAEDHFEIPLSHSHAMQAMNDVAARVDQTQGNSSKVELERDHLLDGFLDIANERMSAAIEQVSIRQGYNPRDYALVAFGGAGGQHACAVAERLGISTIILPEDASLLSALGLGVAVIERFAHKQVLQPLDQIGNSLPSMLMELEHQASDAVATEGVARDRVVIRRRFINMRIVGQDHALAIEVDAGVAEVRDRFESRYRAMYGHSLDGSKAIEVESIRVAASASDSELTTTSAASNLCDTLARPFRSIRARFDGEWRDVPAFARDDIPVGAEIAGPALILERRTTLVIESGWAANRDAARAIIVRRKAAPDKAAASSATAKPKHNGSHAHHLVELEVFTHRLTTIATDMGQMLQRTAISTNVKERLDFSCAVLDAAGELVVNAPHIPVHLGALGTCVRAVRGAIEMRDGDVIVTNHPAFGGSHLPDITVIMPAFSQAGPLLGYVANRAHHAEIGGTRPGSMPPRATSLVEEGVVISPRYLVDRGKPRFDEIERLLRAPPYPSRAVSDNLADLRAAVAANQRGAVQLRALAEQQGAEAMREKMEAIKVQSEQMMREALSHIPENRVEAVERLDDGSPICVSFSRSPAGCIIDFAGSAPQHPGNLNATPAIVRSAVMYVLRLLVGKDVPLNEGIMRAVQVVIPPGMLNPDFPEDARDCPAVVAGNTETSQRLVDTLLKALRLSACSQGTMNNVLFGNEQFGYYETICGGSGAGPGFDGTDAVHTHMTNTRITDPEILEHRYPVRLHRFAIRNGSGGHGQFRGGDGAVREIEFLEPTSLSIVSQHRVEAPFGTAGGDPGACGAQRLLRSNGQTTALNGIDQSEVTAGDRLIVETPGGGGWGKSVT